MTRIQSIPPAHPFRSSITTAAAKTFLLDRGFAMPSIDSLAALQKRRGIAIIVADNESFPHIEGILGSGHLVIIKGICPEEALGILSSPTLQTLPEAILQGYKLDVDAIFVSVWKGRPEKQTAYYLHDSPIEVYFHLYSQTEEELSGLKQVLFRQLDGHKYWTKPDVWLKRA